MLTMTLIFVVACLVSGLGTMIGFGGGVFMIPLLIIVFHVKIQLAVGTVALALFPATLVATAFNSREGLVDYMAALWLEIPTILGAILGAYLTSLLSVQKLEFFFALFLLFISGKMLVKSSLQSFPKRPLINFLQNWGPRLQRSHKGRHYEIGLASATVFGGISGVVAGLFGIGGGFLKTPIMIRVFQMPPKVAVATALLMIVFTSLTSTLSHASLGHIDWSLAIPLVGGFTCGAFLGNLLKKRFTEAHTEKLITVGLFLAGFSIFLHAWQG